MLNLLSTRLGLDHDRVLMGRYGYPGDGQFAVDRGGSINDLDDQNDLLYWYIHQAVWGRYSGSTETIARPRPRGPRGRCGSRDSSASSSTHGAPSGFRPEDFDTQTVGSRFYPVLYMLTRVNDAQDFCTGMPLSSNLLGKGSSSRSTTSSPRRCSTRPASPDSRSTR